jgi:hypothetical protein
MHPLPWKFQGQCTSAGNSKINAASPLEIPRFLNRGVGIIIGIAQYDDCYYTYCFIANFCHMHIYRKNSD